MLIPLSTIRSKMKRYDSFLILPHDFIVLQFKIERLFMKAKQIIPLISPFIVSFGLTERVGVKKNTKYEYSWGLLECVSRDQAILSLIVKMPYYQNFS